MYMHTYDRCHVVFFLINVDRHGHLTGPQISPSTKKMIKSIKNYIKIKVKSVKNENKTEIN